MEIHSCKNVYFHWVIKWLLVCYFWALNSDRVGCSCISRFIVYKPCCRTKSAQTVHHSTKHFHMASASTECEHTGDFRRYKSGYATPTLCARRIFEFVEWKPPRLRCIALGIQTCQILRPTNYGSRPTTTPHVHIYTVRHFALSRSPCFSPADMLSYVSYIGNCHFYLFHYSVS